MNLYYEIFDVVIEQFLPTEMTTATSIGKRLNVSLISFLLDYFHWWPGLIFTLSQLVIQYGGRALMFGEPFTGEVIFQCVINMGLQAFFVWICHICIVKVGMIFVEAEILRTGNEQLLDDLEEGVIIQKDETNETLFMNKAIQ